MPENTRKDMVEVSVTAYRFRCNSQNVFLFFIESFTFFLKLYFKCSIKTNLEDAVEKFENTSNVCNETELKYGVYNNETATSWGKKHQERCIYY